MTLVIGGCVVSQTGDPFLDALRVLQPDVDIVVLPPEDLSADVPSGSPADAAAAARGTSTTTAMLLSESGLADPVANPGKAFERWQRVRDDVHAHRTRTRVEHDDGAAALESLLRVSDVLRDAGWSPAPVDSPTPWVVATSPAGSGVDVAVEGSCLVLTVTSAPMRLEEDPA